jgi:hypothetical protein
MKRKLLALIGVLAMLLGLVLASVFVAAPASAQVVESLPVPTPTVNVVAVNDGAGDEPVPNIYLPIVVFANGEPSPLPDSPYADALSQALADCEDISLNQVCYASGSLKLDGGSPLTTPGQVSALDNISGLTLVSPDADHWSVALLQLAADSPTPDRGLTLLAFGNVEIRNLTLFDTATGNGDVAPALLFSSSPVPGEDPMTGGLIVYNPTDEEPLSIRLNEADLTLASSAVVQAQPGVEMTVTMAIGSALVQTISASDTHIFGTDTVFNYGALIERHALTVPLDKDGKAAGAPSNPYLVELNRLAALAVRIKKDDPLASFVQPEWPSTRDSITVNINAFDDAYKRCLQGNSRQVYRIMYYGRLLQGYNLIYPNILTNDRIAGLDKLLQECATFEIEFNSVITRTGLMAPGNMYIKGQGMIVRYNIDGDLIQSAQMPLKHKYYNVVFPWTGCYYLKIEDGRLILHDDGYMRINRNGLDISTKLIPVDVWEHVYFTCYEKEIEFANPAAWSTMFWDLHESEQILTGFHFTPDDWKYTGNQILAEAIFTGRKVINPDATFTGDTWLVMLHKPGS